MTQRYKTLCLKSLRIYRTRRVEIRKTRRVSKGPGWKVKRTLSCLIVKTSGNHPGSTHKNVIGDVGYPQFKEKGIDGKTEMEVRIKGGDVDMSRLDLSIQGGF